MSTGVEASSIPSFVWYHLLKNNHLCHVTIEADLPPIWWDLSRSDHHICCFWLEAKYEQVSALLGPPTLQVSHVLLF